MTGIAKRMPVLADGPGVIYFDDADTTLPRTGHLTCASSRRAAADSRAAARPADRGRGKRHGRRPGTAVARPAGSCSRTAGPAGGGGQEGQRGDTGTGTGKSHLLIAVGTETARVGYRIRHTLDTKLVNELVEAADDKQKARDRLIATEG